MILQERNADDLMKRVNEYFEKLEKLGYQVIKTDYAAGYMDTWAAFIDYEKKQKSE